jgi:hypothetical protein
LDERGRLDGHSMKFEEVIQPLMHGKPITRACFDHDVYIRYSDLFEAFVMHTGDESKTLQGLTLDSESMFADDWMHGEFHPVKDEIKWTQTKS